MNTTTLLEAWNYYQVKIEAKSGFKTDLSRFHKHLLSFFGDIPLDSITPIDGVNFVACLRKKN